MSASALSTVSCARTDEVVLVSIRAGDAPSFLASMRAMLPEGAVILSPTAPRPEVAAKPGRTPPALTERQREVLTLLSQGLSNKQIARRLALSHFTVRNHVSQILRLFNFSTRHQAKLWGQMAGEDASRDGEDVPCLS